MQHSLVLFTPFPSSAQLRAEYPGIAHHDDELNSGTQAVQERTAEQKRQS
jgi:hypothetical protein